MVRIFKPCIKVIFIDHVHSTREDNVFTCVCDSVHRGRVSPQGDPTSLPPRIPDSQTGDPTIPFTPHRVTLHLREEPQKKDLVEGPGRKDL